MVATSVNAVMAPLETATAVGEPLAVNGTTVPTSRSSRMSVMLPIVPRETTANWLEPSVVLAMYAMFALSGLSASHATCQAPWVASAVSRSCCEMPPMTRQVCCARVSPDGRGVAAVAASADSVMQTWGGVGVVMLTPGVLAEPGRTVVDRTRPAGRPRCLTTRQQPETARIHAFGRTPASVRQRAPRRRAQVEWRARARLSGPPGDLDPRHPAHLPNLACSPATLPVRRPSRQGTAS